MLIRLPFLKASVMRFPPDLFRPVPAVLAALVLASGLPLAPGPATATPIDFLDQVQTDDDRLQGVLESIQSGQTVQARARLEPILAANPALAPAQELLGVIHALEGDLDAAIAAFERAVELNPGQGSALTKLGDVHLALGDRAAARGYFERALAILPEDRLTHQRLGLLAEEDGDIAAAIRHYEAGIRGMPADTLGVKINLALLYNRTGAPDRARDLLAPFAARDDTPALVRRALGNAHLALGDSEAAIAQYRQALARAPGDAATALGLGAALTQAGAAPEAVELLAPFNAADPADDAVALLLARAQAAADDAGGARATLEAALSAASDAGRRAAPDLHLDLGALQQAAGDLDAAEATYAALQRAYPDSAAPYLAQGALLGLQRRYAEALTAFEAGLARAPEHPGLLRGALRAHQREGRVAAARDMGRRLAATEAAQATDLFYLGTLEEAAGDTDRAIAAYEGAIERDPDLWPALNNLAVLLIGRDAAAEALPRAERARALHPDHPAVHHTLGLALLRTDRAAEAEAPLREAVGMAPENAAYLRSLAEAAAALGRGDEARDLLTRARAAGLDPAEARALEARIGG
jgi:cellulose synthase operon protein C